MNVIYNLEDKEVYVMAVVGKIHFISTLKLSEEYLKKKKIKYLINNEIQNLVSKKSEHEVKNEDITIELKVS